MYVIFAATNKYPLLNALLKWFGGGRGPKFGKIWEKPDFFLRDKDLLKR